MAQPPVIELPQRTRLHFVGGSEKVLPMAPQAFRQALGQAGKAGALFITVPMIAGTFDLNISNLAWFEQDLEGA